MNALSITILAIAFICLGIGLFLYIANTRRNADRQYFYTTNIICWILIALFPALVIFSLFPQSNINGSLFGFSMTGAVALFVFIWWFGTRNSLKAVQIDELNNKMRALEEDLKKSQDSRPTGAKTPLPLTETKVFSYPLKNKNARGKKIAIVTGNIRGVKCADIWVNSENTNMQMSRFYERSISGTIRYLGARKDIAGDVVEDLIMNELAALMGVRFSVQPATVLVTDSGQLRATNNVKKIFHVASVRGEVASGYQPIDNIEFCVQNALSTVNSDDLRKDPCKTIVFPLFGTGAGKAQPEQVAARLMTAAIEYLESNENTTLETVYFLAWTDRDLEICKSALASTGRVVV